MSADSDNSQAQLVKIAKAIGAILGAPLALFAILNGVFEQPVSALIVALTMAIVASAWVVRSGRTGITEAVVAWLALVVVVLAGFPLCQYR
jgi:hypothetical protein